jgi:hypothetical protein
MLDIGREISSIAFYDDNGIITTSRSGWLESEFDNAGNYDIQGVVLSLELKHFKRNYNLEKAMSNKCHFTINNEKTYHLDEPSCTLYLYVNGVDFELVAKEEYQRLFTYSADLSYSIQPYSHTTIKAMHGIIKRGCIEEDTEIKVACYERTCEKITLSKEKDTELLNKTIAEFKELGIYLKESDIGKILDNYKLTKKETSTIDKLIPSIIAKHGEFKEINKY